MTFVWWTWCSLTTWTNLMMRIQHWLRISSKNRPKIYIKVSTHSHTPIITSWARQNSSRPRIASKIQDATTTQRLICGLLDVSYSIWQLVFHLSKKWILTIRKNSMIASGKPTGRLSSNPSSEYARENSMIYWPNASIQILTLEFQLVNVSIMPSLKTWIMNINNSRIERCKMFSWIAATSNPVTYSRLRFWGTW